MNRRPRAGWRSRGGRHLIGAVALTAAVVTTLTGCSALNGSSDSSSSASPSAGASGVEKPNINIGILSGPDDSPIKLAQVDGIFKSEGLNPTVKVFQSGPSMYPAIASGALDIAETNYVNYFTAVDRKTLNAKIIGDAYAATPPSFVILVPPNSPIKTPADLAGKKIATQAPGNICELLVRDLMTTNNLDPNSPKYEPVHFPDMPAALKSGQVDAAVEFEPFITEAERNDGAKVPFPLITSATNDIPLSGYAANPIFVQNDPKTVAAFQRALVTAHEKITNRSELAKAMPALTGVDPSLVPMLNMGNYPTSLDATRLQRVITLMKQFGVLAPTDPLQAKDYIVPFQNS
jgi:NitT/TauT family transport system substrate-binding protein